MIRRSHLTPLSLLFAGALLALSCVQVDPDTGETIPRGNQYYEYDEVKRNAEKLELGMSKLQVQALLGSPAEKEAGGNVWVYLPERAAVIVPSKALKLEFKNGALASHGYHAIILGARL